MKAIAATIGISILAVFNAGAGELLNVTVIDRQDNSSSYTYSVPGYSNSHTTADANCAAYGNMANCRGSSSTSTFSNPGFVGSYEVQGATLTLRLPDQRLVVVNCSSKVNWTEWSNPGMFRSCRTPLVSKIQAEFSGDSAKLRWPVSIDGKKLQRETYKILGIIDAPEGQQ